MDSCGSSNPGGVGQGRADPPQFGCGVSAEHGVCGILNACFSWQTVASSGPQDAGGSLQEVVVSFQSERESCH